MRQDQVLAFFARLGLVLIFPFSALNKIFDHRSAMAQASQGWIPPTSMAALLLVLGGILEVFGPICVLLDFYRREAALLFVFYVIVTAVLFHNFWSFPFNSDQWTQNSGRSSRISGSRAAFSTSLPMRGWARFARPSP